MLGELEFALCRLYWDPGGLFLPFSKHGGRPLWLWQDGSFWCLAFCTGLNFNDDWPPSNSLISWCCDSLQGPEEIFSSKNSVNMQNRYWWRTWDKSIKALYKETCGAIRSIFDKTELPRLMLWEDKRGGNKRHKTVRHTHWWRKTFKI